MDSKDILKDETLDALGLIKDMDTLSIIQEAQDIMDKRLLLIKNAVLVLLGLIIISINIIVFVTTGIQVFLLFQLVLSWFAVILFIPLFKKKYSKGV